MSDDRVRMPLIDVMVCTTCELRCVGCTNHIGGLARFHLFPLDEVKLDIDLAANALHAEVAVLLGGEPLQHPKLVEIMRHAKTSGIADRVRVLTNGIRLHRMSDEFWDELDDLRVSVYPGETPPENVELARARAAEHGFEFSTYDVARQPFRAVLTVEPRSAVSAQETFDRCWYKSNTRKLQRGFLYRCCTSPTIARDVLGRDEGADGVPLAGLTADGLRTFLARAEFMESCTRCYGNLGPELAPWREQRDRTRWLDESMVPA